MKRLNSNRFCAWLVTACLLVSGQVSVGASAIPDTDPPQGVDQGYRYVLTDGGCAIIRLEEAQSVETAQVLPDTLDGYAVVSLGLIGRGPDDLIERQIEPTQTVFPQVEWESVTLPESLTAIGDGAFSGLQTLRSLTLPDGVDRIGLLAFAHDTGLTEITLPEHLTTLDGFTFYDCTGLRELVLPDGLRSLGPYTFSGCTDLTVTVPPSVTDIAKNAFSDAQFTWKFVPNAGGTTVPELHTYSHTGLRLIVWPESVAHQNALKNGIPFTLVMEYESDTPGDIDGDGGVNATDALLALQHSVKLVELRGSGRQMADLDGSGAVDAADALWMLQIAVKLK